MSENNKNFPNNSEFNHKRSIITFATNKKSYFKFALNCAQSILLHNNIHIYIVTNLKTAVPVELMKNVHLIEAAPSHAKLGVGIKLFIDKYLQTEETLFIDSDCICYSSLNPIFDACKNKDVSVAGLIVNAEDFCGLKQASVIYKNFNIKKLIRFNGGLYYLKKSPICIKVFDDARQIIPRYDEFGFDRINNKWINEEGLISISMILNNQTPIPDDGRYMTDLFTDPKPSNINPLTGIRILNNPEKSHKKHRAWYPIGNYSPIILHYGNASLNSYPYITQVLLLKLNSFLPRTISNCLVVLLIEVPYKIFLRLKNIFKAFGG